MNPNQREVFEDRLHSGSRLTEYELQQLLFAVLDHLELSAFRTNDNKHGQEEIVVR